MRSILSYTWKTIFFLDNLLLVVINKNYGGQLFWAAAYQAQQLRPNQNGATNGTGTQFTQALRRASFPKDRRFMAAIQEGSRPPEPTAEHVLSALTPKGECVWDDWEVFRFFRILSPLPVTPTPCSVHENSFLAYGGGGYPWSQTGNS